MQGKRFHLQLRGGNATGKAPGPIRKTGSTLGIGDCVPFRFSKQGVLIMTGTFWLASFRNYREGEGAR